MKKALSIIFMILTFFIIYFLQANFFTWFNISGIMPNLFVIYVLFIGLFVRRKLGLTFGIIFGLILDLIIGKNVGITALVLGGIGFLAEVLSKNFSKDSRFTMMLMILVATVIYEVCIYFFGIFKTGASIELFDFIKILVVEILFNEIITIIIYPLMKNIGYHLEDLFEDKVMITRFF